VAIDDGGGGPISKPMFRFFLSLSFFSVREQTHRIKSRLLFLPIERVASMVF